MNIIMLFTCINSYLDKSGNTKKITELYYIFKLNNYVYNLFIKLIIPKSNINTTNNLS